MVVAIPILREFMQKYWNSPAEDVGEEDVEASDEGAWPATAQGFRQLPR